MNKENMLQDRVKDNTIVLFRLSAMGDVALLTGVMRYWHEVYGVRFVLITREAFAPLFYGHPALVCVESLTREDLQTSKGFRKKAKDLAQKYGELPFFDMHASTRSRIMASFWKGRVLRYNKYPFYRRLFLWSRGFFGAQKLLEKNVCQRYVSVWGGENVFDEKVLENNLHIGEKSDSANSMQAIEHTPIPKEKLIPQIYLSRDEKEKACARLTALFGCFVADFSSPYCVPTNSFGGSFGNSFGDSFGANASGGNLKKIIAIHPFATHENKSLSMDKWQALSVAIEAKFAHTHEILWLGIGEIPENFVGKSLVNQSTLRELCALLSCCDVLLTGDSGPMHLANAVGCKILAIFGPTCEEWGFFPVEKQGGKKYKIQEVEQELQEENQGYEQQEVSRKTVCVLQKNVSCRPCSLHGGKSCKNNKKCFSFTNEEILLMLEKLLNNIL